MYSTNINIKIFIFFLLCKYDSGRNASHISSAHEKPRISYRPRFSCRSFFCFRDAYHKRGIVSTLPCSGRARRRLDGDDDGKEVAKRARGQRLRNGHAAVTWIAPLRPLKRSEFLPWLTRYANTRKTRNGHIWRIVWRDATLRFCAEYLLGSVRDRTKQKLVVSRTSTIEIRTFNCAESSPLVFRPFLCVDRVSKKKNLRIFRAIASRFFLKVFY